MREGSVRAILEALGSAGVRFLIAGGLAVNAHGYHRFTKDLDLVAQLGGENLASMFTALAALGYRPLVPITAEQLADPELRERLIREKHMRVLQFWSDAHPETPIDVFVREPFAFDEEYARAVLKEFTGVGPVRIVSLRTLIDMKQKSGRPEDLIDSENLRLLLEES